MPAPTESRTHEAVETVYVNGTPHYVLAETQDRQGALLLVRRPRGRKEYLARRLPNHPLYGEQRAWSNHPLYGEQRAWIFHALSTRSANPPTPESTGQHVYAVRCDECKSEIRRTTSLRESAAGGRCEECRSALPSDRAMAASWDLAQRRDESACEEDDAAGWDGSLL